MYKEHLLKIWGGYRDSFQNGSLWSYGSEKPIFFFEITKISKARNTFIKNNVHQKIIYFNTYFLIFL